MPAAYTDLFVEAASDFQASLTLNDVYGVPYDLTDYTVSGSIKKSYFSSRTYATFDITTGNPQAGIINISLTNTDTANLSHGRYLYDIVISTGGTKTRVLEGFVIVDPAVTTS